MIFLDKLKRKLPRVIGERIDPSSLQFRLTVEIIVIFTVGFSSFTMWMGWEIKQFLIMNDRQYSVCYDNQRLLIAIQNVGTVSVLIFITTAILTFIFIRRSLFPLRQMNQWVITYGAELKQYPSQLRRTPSEVKALAQTWNELLARLSEVKEQQQQFTNDLAHELRTPLSMVYAYLQRTLQRSQNLTESQKESLAMAVSDAERMTYILQDLLELARAGSNAMPLQAKPLILNDAIADIVQMAEKFDHRAIQLKLASFPIKVKAERDRLMQVLYHLIDNAFQYSDVGETVTVQLGWVNGWAVIQVSDKGCGIPLSEQARIFEPFYRVDPSRTRSTGGTGLGLPIVKRLVESMGGNVGICSEPGHGSTFILKLPALGEKI
ncbi:MULTISPECIES: sensor histidine kinase [Nostocales]|uniref:histidine kinase n=4 Tax=Nostocales TaxID=1161 RepID=A0A8S9SZ13_9CYAN|nr:HAMP domain-containing sensor histidine kinase [Tolypothrix bouteillei]KAF3885086.1 HAMP domain-containing histidine kinase [Tolypothrix bouteillei VB521301]